MADQKHYLVSQAFICWAAASELSKSADALYPKYGVHDSYVHMMGNNMDDCTSYNTHKYIDRAPIEAFMKTVTGSGVVGFWSFKDGSRLVRLCARYFGDGTMKDLYVVMNPSKEKDDRSIMMFSMEEWPQKSVKLLLTPA